MSEWLQLALGPLGALVLTVTFAVAAARILVGRHQAEVDRLHEALKARQESEAKLQAALDEEHRARLSDAKETTKQLLELHDRIHRTLDALETLSRRHQ